METIVKMGKTPKIVNNITPTKISNVLTRTKIELSILEICILIKIYRMYLVQFYQLNDSLISCFNTIFKHVRSYFSLSFSLYSF